MTRLSLSAPKRVLTLSLSALATLFTLGLTGPTSVQAADKGYITAKTWYDASNTSHPYAIGDGVSDDTQNLQDLINYGTFHAEAVQLEPGIYKITKTLVIADNVANDQKIGFRLSGIGGPNDSPFNAPPPGGPRGGVSILMDASATAQPAVLEVGVGAFYDMTIENIGLVSKVPMTQNTPPAPALSYGTQYGLLFTQQQFSHVYVHMVTVASVGTAFANVQGGTGGTNGEAVNLDNCTSLSSNCFYSNNVGQSFYHRLINCGCLVNNGGVAIKTGSGGLAFDLDVSSFSCSFVPGPLRNTLLENDGISGCVNVKGGRIENVDTLLAYIGGAPQANGHVTIKGMDLTDTNLYFGSGNPAPVLLKTFPLVDDTLYGTSTYTNEQYSNTFEDLVINTGLVNGTNTVFPALSLASLNGDNSRNYFVRCDFTGFSNTLTSAGNQPALTNLGAILTNCRAATGDSNVFSPISGPPYQ